MITVRHGQERGVANYGWLKSRHSFSFAEYYDPEFLGYSALRVINDDRVDPGAGFPTHPHRNMEIISYVLDGAMEHRDSMGYSSVIRPGDIQRMSAGTGITHSEFNASDTEGLRFLQIWVMPNKNGLKPSYEQKHFDTHSRQGRLRLVASADGSDGSITIQQDARIYAGLFKRGEQDEIMTSAERKLYVHVARGSIVLDEIELNEGDGAYIEQQDRIKVGGLNDKEGEVLVFDLPGQTNK